MARKDVGGGGAKPMLQGRWMEGPQCLTGRHPRLPFEDVDEKVQGLRRADLVDAAHDRPRVLPLALARQGPQVRKGSVAPLFQSSLRGLCRLVGVEVAL